MERGGGRLDGSEKVVAVELMEECTAFQVVVDEVRGAGDPEGHSSAAEIGRNVF